MPDPLIPCPRWLRKTLDEHYGKRTTVDAGCFEDLLGISGRQMTVDEYRQRSLDTVANAWAVYLANKIDLDSTAPPGTRLGLRKYHVDSDIVMSVIDVDGIWFITCFHRGHPKKEHANTKHHRKWKGEIGDRQLEFRKDIFNDIRGEVLIDFIPDKGFPVDFSTTKTMALRRGFST